VQGCEGTRQVTSILVSWPDPDFCKFKCSAWKLWALEQLVSVGGQFGIWLCCGSLAGDNCMQIWLQLATAVVPCEWHLPTCLGRFTAAQMLAQWLGLWACWDFFSSQLACFAMH
jgi:hypothetical protein